MTDQDREQSFLICIDDNVKAGTVKALGLKKHTLFVCHGNALTD